MGVGPSYQQERGEEPGVESNLTWRYSVTISCCNQTYRAFVYAPSGPDSVEKIKELREKLFNKLSKYPPEVSREILERGGFKPVYPGLEHLSRGEKEYSSLEELENFVNNINETPSK